jgi:hypothetical protein
LDWIHLAKEGDQWRSVVNYGVEPSSSMKCWENLEYQSDRRHLKKDSAPWSYFSLVSEDGHKEAETCKAIVL